MGEDHHFRTLQGGAVEQRPPFADESPVSWVCLWRTLCLSVCFDRIDGLWDELAAIAFVSGQFTVGVHLTLESIEEVWTCGD